MRTTSLFALSALAVLASCSDPGAANETPNVEIENGGLSPLASDAGADGGGGSGGGPVHQFKATSDIATASGYGIDISFFLRAGKGTDGKVHVDFWSMYVDPTSFVCGPPPWDPMGWWFCGYTRRISTQAYGTLPSTSYKSGQGYAYLTANLANGPTLTVTKCTSDDMTFTTTCVADPGGPVDVRWRPNGWFSSSRTGTIEYQYGSIRYRMAGSTSSQGADVTGSIFGTTIDGSFGDITRSTGAAIQFDSFLK